MTDGMSGMTYFMT